MGYGVNEPHTLDTQSPAAIHFFCPFVALESGTADESGRALRPPVRPVPLRPSLPDEDGSPRPPAMRTFTPRPIAPTLPTMTRSPTSRPDVTCTIPVASSTTPSCTGWCSTVSLARSEEHTSELQ